MKKAELVFIPWPVIGHLLSTVEMAKLLIDRDDRFSITFLIMKLPPFDSKDSTYNESLADSITMGVKFVQLPQPDQTSELTSKSSYKFLSAFINSHIPHIREAVAQLINSPDSAPLAGFVVDMLCTSMMEIADELGVPSYVFFTSSAAFLGLVLHLQTLHDRNHQDITEFGHSDTELVVPSFANLVPTRVLPRAVVDKDGWSTWFLNNGRRFRETKGIIVNTFAELELYALDSLNDGTTKIPPIYPLGPILNLTGRSPMGSSGTQENAKIMAWLDDQPPSSVVFLCFGSLGSFGGDQVKEIARGLELCGHRFLWSLRQPPPPNTDGIPFPTDYNKPDEVLPEGFLERTAGIGRIIGWAPQVAVLSHSAIGGFVSHCGWNSTLESLWYGVPVATWPMYSEQQLNAFEMGRELGLAVEIRLDYRKDSGVVVSAEEVERGIKCVMESDSEVRRKVKKMKEKSRNAVVEGGSSYSALGNFVEHVIHNMTSESNPAEDKD